MNWALLKIESKIQLKIPQYFLSIFLLSDQKIIGNFFFFNFHSFPSHPIFSFWSCFNRVTTQYYNLLNIFQKKAKLDLSNFYEPNPVSRSKSVDIKKRYENYDVYADHANSVNWFKAEFTREQAIEALNGRPSGTYLVRPNAKPISKYILSLAWQDQVKHILIEEDLAGCNVKFVNSGVARARENSSMLQETLSASSASLNSVSSIGSTILMNENTPKFKTLSELVFFYAQNRIKDENGELDAVLVQPAFL